MIEIVTYQSDFAQAFADLNKEWIEAFFEIEAEDLKMLENPEGYVLAGGGEIFFALSATPQGVKPVGTVAMVKQPPVGEGVVAAPVFELAKMAVAPSQQGKGISHMLMNACVDFARNRGASEIFLVTNDVLKPAMALYEKSGFVRLPKIEDARYSRGNTEMRLSLDPLLEGEVAGEGLSARRD